MIGYIFNYTGLNFVLFLVEECFLFPNYFHSRMIKVFKRWKMETESTVEFGIKTLLVKRRMALIFLYYELSFQFF